MNVIDRINELCRKHHLSKYKLSMITGISQSAFSKMSKQQSTLSLDTIQRICDAFGISLAQFFSTTDEYPDLTEQQKQLLHAWSLLDTKKRDYALLLIQKLLEL